MPVPTVTEVEEFKEDIDDAEAIVNGSTTVSTRLGGNKESLDQLLSKIVVGTITAYSAATTYTSISEWIEESGATYRPLPSALPIGPEAFDSSHWAATNASDAENIDFTSTATVADKLNNLDKDDYTELRAITPAQYENGDTITVTDAGIAGPGQLRKVTAHGLTDDLGTMIVIDVDTYWQREYYGKVHVTWFEPGSTAAANTTAVQAALNTGKNITIEGDYTITTQLESVASKQKIFFDGGSLTADASFTDDAVLNITHTYVKVMYPDIDGNSVAGELAGIKCSAKGCSVWNGEFYNCTGSGIVKSGSAEYFRDVGNYFFNCYNDAVDSAGANNHRGDYGIVALGLYEDTVNTTISTNNVSNVIFALNTGAGKAGSEATSGGILLEASTGSYNNVIIGNTWANMGVEAYQVAGITEGTAIVGNSAKDCNEGIKVFGQQVEGTVSVGNTLSHSSNGDDQIAAIDINSSQKNIVALNYCDGYKRGLRTLNTEATPEDLISLGNMFKGNSNKAIYCYAENMIVGFSLIIGDGVASDGLVINALSNTSDTVMVSHNLIRSCPGTGLEGLYNNEARFLMDMNMTRNCGTELNTSGRATHTQFRNIPDTAPISGEFTINGTTVVTVSTTQINTDAKLSFYPKTPTGTEGAVIVTSIVNGVSFGVRSSDASDSSVWQWTIDK